MAPHYQVGMRNPRVDFPGARHHVYNRGRRREPMFNHPDACKLYLALLSEVPARFEVAVHGYALMPNHFHLMLESRTGRLSEAMQWLMGSFVQRLNRRRGWDGPIYTGRFHNIPVADERHWMHLLPYLHLNPVRKGMLATPGDAWWTSHRAYVAEVGDTWLTTSELLGLHGGLLPLLDYIDAVQRGRADPEGFQRLRPEHRADARKAAVLELRETCRELASTGLSVRAIAQKVGRSRGAVERALKL